MKAVQEFSCITTSGLVKGSVEQQDGLRPQKEEKAEYMSDFQYVIDIFSNKLNNAHSWSSISKKTCGLYS